MKILLVLCHPLPDSLNARLAKCCQSALQDQGHEVVVHDLYAQGFDPRLTREERGQYYDRPFEDRINLQEAQGLVLVFPTWWFGLPAMLKGWVDRCFAPGVAYDHHPTGGPMSPRLDQLKSVMVVTTLGSPGWIDHLIMRRPVRRILKWGVIKPCARHARFAMLSLYRAETVAPARIARFEAKINRLTAKIFQ
ncbi:MAG: NAD(P)H-dependent oxidoreductase [Pelagimonas sp.]|jgi:putative NADPH-quinone reductase|nr:NAD(P)H-dependent oxidoreductase [Pelagimonas sp.]